MFSFSAATKWCIKLEVRMQLGRENCPVTSRSRSVTISLVTAFIKRLSRPRYVRTSILIHHFVATEKLNKIYAQEEFLNVVRNTKGSKTASHGKSRCQCLATTGDQVRPLTSPQTLQKSTLSWFNGRCSFDPGSVPLVPEAHLQPLVIKFDHQQVLKPCKNLYYRVLMGDVLLTRKMFL